ncbi:hypothetical protein Fmac_030254 [Flemingia macrophylla]|uniref:Uncharacterized protein n=1 Tax=Flemingia macrophylla TaxID=520843 RepID=A0ABD1LCM3_9FABA
MNPFLLLLPVSPILISGQSYHIFSFNVHSHYNINHYVSLLISFFVLVDFMVILCEKSFYIIKCDPLLCFKLNENGS